MDAQDRPVVGFTMIAHALFHAYELSIPLFVVVWLDAFSVTEALLGVVVGVGYAAIGLGAVPSGVLSDRYGSSTVVLGALVGMGGGFALISLSPGPVVLALALIVWGAAASLYHPAGLSLLSRRVDQRGTAFAYHGAAGNVGTVLGPLLTAVLLVFIHWRLVALALVVPAAAGAFVAARLPLGHNPSDDGGATADAEPGTSLWTDARGLFTAGFVVIFVAVLLYGLYYRGVLTFLPEILGDLPVLDPIEMVGYQLSPGQYVYAGLLSIGVLGQYAGGRLTDAVQSTRALTGAFALLAVGALAFLPAAAAGVVPLLIVCVLLGFAIYVTAPIYQAVVAEHVVSDTHGLSYGVTYLGMFGIGALGAPLSGIALAYADAGALFLALAAIATLGGLLGLTLAVKGGRNVTAGTPDAE